MIVKKRLSSLSSSSFQSHEARVLSFLSLLFRPLVSSDVSHSW